VQTPHTIPLTAANAAASRTNVMIMAALPCCRRDHMFVFRSRQEGPPKAAAHDLSRTALQKREELAAIASLGAA